MAIPVIPFVADDLACTFRREVADEHIDVMGHMNITFYTEFMGRGLWHLFKDHLGGDRPDFSEQGMVMLEQYMRYLSECLRGETVAAYPRVVGASKRCAHLVCYLYNETRGRLSAHCEVLFTGMDTEKRKARRLPAWLRESFTATAAEHNALSWGPSLCGVIRAF